MITAGCDIGSLTGKAAVMEGGKIIATSVRKVRGKPADLACEVLDEALEKAGMSMNDIDFCVGTGYGRKNIPFADAVESEIACHGRGAVWRNPAVRTVIDIGGQDAKAIRVDGSGAVSRYAYNDKCASGTGRFLEIIAGALDLGLEELGVLSLESSGKMTLSNQCVVFAETEIISLVNEGTDIPEIVDAMHRAVAGRVASLARSIEVEEPVAMTGGVARNQGMFRALGTVLGCGLVVIDEPQVNGAVGAALIAADCAEKNR